MGWHALQVPGNCQYTDASWNPDKISCRLVPDKIRTDITKSSAVAVITDRTAHDIRYSCRPLSGIAVISMSIYVFTASNWSLLLKLDGCVFLAKRYILERKCRKKWILSVVLGIGYDGTTFNALHRPLMATKRSSQTDRETCDSAVPIADHTVCSSMIS